MRDRNYYQGNISRCRENRQRNRVIFGIGIALIGVLLLFRTMGLLPDFDLNLSWPVILVIIGLLIGIKNNFRRNAWWILIFIGGVNLIPQFPIFNRPSRHYVWPLAIIIGGVLMALRPRRDKYAALKKPIDFNLTAESDLDIDVTFGGRKEVVTSKDFKGGTVNVTFGGCELNLTQADFTSPSIIIDCQVSFGGVEIIVPSHWEIQNEVSPAFGSVEDDRTIQTPTSTDTKKILVIKGNCSFGSIEIKSY